MRRKKRKRPSVQSFIGGTLKFLLITFCFKTGLFNLVNSELLGFGGAGGNDGCIKDAVYRCIDLHTDCRLGQNGRSHRYDNAWILIFGMR